jgi:hypothetical protein
MLILGRNETCEIHMYNIDETLYQNSRYYSQSWATAKRELRAAISCGGFVPTFLSIRFDSTPFLAEKLRRSTYYKYFFT